MKIPLLCATLIAGSAVAANDQPVPAKPADKPAAATSAMRVYMDPKTGKLVEQPIAPVPKESAAGVDFSKIVEIRHADGSTETQFNGQADSTLVVEAAPDGTLRYRCSEHGHVHDHAAQESHDEPR